MRHPITFRLMALSLFLLSASALLAATATDYYNAGLQLYNAKNYAQAIQYFSAAISLDPNNTASLQGRANCYYATGNYQGALADYQKVQTIQPNPQLNAFIQSLQAKVNSTAQPPMPGVTGTSDSFNQGVALYQQKQFQAAIPLFQQATRENRSDSKAYYYLGASQIAIGDIKDAALNLTLSDKRQANPSIEAYVAQLRAKLSPEDQQWVDGQVVADSVASSGRAYTPADDTHYQVRLEPEFVMVDLADFKAEAAAATVFFQGLQAMDPSLTYTATVPQGYPNIGFEGDLKMGPDMELGLTLGYAAVGTFSEQVTENVGAGVTTQTDAFDISAIPVGVNFRYFFGSGDMRFWGSVGPMVAPVMLNLTNNYGGTTGNMMGMGIGGKIELGMDYKLGNTFTIGPAVGYQLCTADNFSASVKGGAYDGQDVKLYYNANAGATYPLLSLYPSSATVPTGWRTAQVDLSGLTAGLHIAFSF
jgi:tetratricopeptide (TPR) repeat protein